MQTRYSANYGETFAAAEVTAGAVLGVGAFDLVRIGPGALAADAAGVEIATTAGGTYSAYSTIPASGTPAVVLVPRYELGSTATSNANTTPEYILASSTLATGNTAVWEVTASGATLTNITPNDGAEYGLAVDPRCVGMPWRSALRLAAILLFGTDRKLMVKTNVGAGSTTWTERDTLTADASAVTYRKGDTTLNELYGTDGGVWYSPDHGATLYSKNVPDEPVTVISVYG